MSATSILSRFRSEPPRGTEPDEQAVQALRLVRNFEEQASGWFWEADRAGNLTYLSARVIEQMGRTAADVIGHPVTRVFQVSGHSQGAERTLGFHLNARAAFVDFEVQAVGGGERLWSMSGRPLMDAVGQFRGFVGSGSDLTHRRRAEAEITRLALSDSLTGLANRERIRTVLDQTLATRAGTRQPVALLLMDLDRFKAVNDTLGHQTGDELLKQVAGRIERAVGQTTLVGRIGGDEFMVVIPNEGNRDELTAQARATIAALSRPYQIGGAAISIGCSIGIAIAPDDGEDATTLVRNADLALYAAKGAGRGTHRFFEPGLLAEAQSRKRLEDELREALTRDELHLVYQSVVSTRDGAIGGYEALLRWTHPVRGPISPGEFIPVAEDSGLIDTIGEWVMRTACRAAAGWPKPARIAVNVSPIQFGKPGFPAIVAAALAESGLAPERLELEITESVFLGGTEGTAITFDRLKALGVRLALDDFGTGYSSLGYLKSAPFDKIKIDQSFVRGASIAGNRNIAIIKAIVTLADALGMETTAEGVEAQNEIELIRELGCSHIQGFVYGRPMPAAAVIEQLGGAAAATPIGVRMSRAPRIKMLRSVQLEADGWRGAARLRDVSSGGAMIDQYEPLEVEPGSQVAIELLEGDPIMATVRWTRDGRAGLQLLRTFDFARLSAPFKVRRPAPA